MHQKTLIALTAAFALGACARGTQVTSGGDVTAATPVTRNWLPPGTTMTARLNQNVSTSSHEGDAFTATIAQNVYAQDGSVAVPAGAVVRGHVTGVHNASLPTDQSVIRLDFDELQMNGRTYPFDASISNVDVENQSTGGINKNTGRDAATGAAAGAVLGAVIGGGDLSKIITGGLLGAAAGTVVSMGMGGGAVGAT